MKRIGLGASLPLPQGRLVSFGLAGALAPGLEPGALVTARRVVDEGGEILWEGEPLDVPGARAVVVCAATRIIDDPAAREELAARTGAQVVDMESGAVARSGRLAGVVRAVSDTAARPVGRLAHAGRPDGRVDLPVILGAFATQPIAAFRAAWGARAAFAALERASTFFAAEAEPGAGRPARARAR